MKQRQGLSRRRLRRIGHGQPEQLVDLQQGDDKPDPRRKAGGHRVGDEADEAPHLRKAHGDENQSGQKGCDQQAAHAVRGDDRGEDDHKGRGRSADLEPRPTQRRRDEGGDDRGHQPSFG